MAFLLLVATLGPERVFSYSSDVPHGNNGIPLQQPRGHLPKMGSTEIPFRFMTRRTVSRPLGDTTYRA
eukprot:scaffold204847_cov41-Attheya_sp.AAC.3